MYRTNKFFQEKFTIVYTDKGFIRNIIGIIHICNDVTDKSFISNIIADMYYADDDLITH